MPSISSGFWVASTKKGFGNGRVVSPTLTVRSCIPSSRADCVLGVARFTSSARTILAKMGPGWKLNTRLLPVELPSSLTIVVPTISAGIRSGVNWIRANFRASASATVRTSSVLPRPGTPSRSTWPPANSASSNSRITRSWPITTEQSSFSNCWAISINSVISVSLGPST